jgi:RNA polymerase-associated protein CTR9
MEAEEISLFYTEGYRKNFILKADDVSDRALQDLLYNAEDFYQQALLTLSSESYKESKEPWFLNALQSTIRYNIARLFETRGEYDTARNQYKEILNIHPAYDDCMLRLGAIEQSKGNNESALEYFSDALALDPTNAKAWFMIGHYHMISKNNRVARKSFDKALECDKYDVYALCSVGYMNLLFARGDPANVF